MNYIKNTWNVFDNYLLARWQRRPSTASFWYLPEPPNITHENDLSRYKQSSISPIYLIDYRQKLHYLLQNKNGIIVLPYQKPIGYQINPEAAFQYALGLHDQFYMANDETFLVKFKHYANYFLKNQTKDGLWGYYFDWYGSKSPWYSALAQARGASVMLRAWQLSGDEIYLTAAKSAVEKFHLPTEKGGFLHIFSKKGCAYFEEYPNTPTGVINGFMACLMSLWELKFWVKEKSFDELWQLGIHSLETMLPCYSTGWWSLYDLDEHSPIINVNSPRYHLLEIHYLQILSILSKSDVIMNEFNNRVKQYNSSSSRLRALSLKLMRKILYK